MNDIPYGHTPIDKAFGGDVYGVAYDAQRASRRPIRLGMIGAGGVAQSKYFPAVARLRMIWEPIVIAAFAEPREDHGRKVQSIYGGEWYPDADTMVANAELDGVLVLSPDDRHAEHTLACLEAGLPVLVEKPIARSLADADAMCRAAEARGLTLMTVANKRLSPPYRRARDLIEYGRLRDPALFVGKFNLGYDYVDLLESGTIHLFDIALYLMGPAASVSAAGTRRYSDSSYPIDNVAAAVTFASGAVGSITSSASALSLKPWERVEVYGNHAWLAVEDQFELTVYEGEAAGAKVWRPAIPNTLLFDEEFSGYMGIVENFAQAIRGMEAPVSTGRDGYRAFELLTAVKLALLHRTWIPLPLDIAPADADARQWLDAGL